LTVTRLNLYTIITHNIQRRPYRTAAIILSVMLVTGTLFGATLAMRSVQHSLRVGLERMGADVIVVPSGQETPAQEAFIVGQPTTFYMDGSVEREISGLPGVGRTSPQVFVQSLANASCCVGEFFLVSFDPATDFTISPWLATNLTGRTIQPNEIIVGDRILLHVEDSVKFYGSIFRVVGKLAPTGMGLDSTVFVPIAGLRQMIAASPERAEKALTIGASQVSTVQVKVQPGADPKQVAEDVERRVKGITAITASQMTMAVSRQFAGLLGVIVAVIASLWLMSLVLIALVFSLVVNERQREIGLLRAMGARRGVVFRLIMGEALALTGIGGALGVFVSGVLLVSFQGLIEKRLRVPFLLPNWPEAAGLVAIMLLLALASGALAALQPAYRISRMDPYEAIRRGE
jgi:putative ABC transport system permease protein